MASQTPDLTPRTSDPRLDAAAVAILVACLAAMFWKVLFTPAMFFYRDVYNYTYPSARLIHDLCRQGFLPYWNPYLNYGQPVLANPNLLFFYPFTLLIILLPINVAFILHFVVHFGLAGIGVYLLARAWKQTYRGAFFAAFVFMFSGPAISLGNIYNLAACTAWIPWALLLTHRALETSRRRPWVLLCVVFSLQWLAGEPLTMLGTFCLCLAYAFYRRGAGEKVWSITNLKLVTRFVLVGVVMLLLCSAQFLPASFLLSQSRRGMQGLSFGETTTWSMNPLSLLEMLVADFFGSGIGAQSGWLRLVHDPNLGPHYLSIFLGFVPLFCALAGWALGRDRRRNFAAGAAGIFLLLAFGRNTPVFALAYLLFPPLTVVRYPVKLLVLVTLLVAILAGWGLDAFGSANTPWRTHGRRLHLPVGILLGSTLAVLAISLVLPGLITSPTHWILQKIGETAFNLRQMPDFLVTILRYELPGLAGFCLGGLLLAYGLQQGKRWARPGVYAFALLGMAQLVGVNHSANPTVPKSFYTYRPPVLKEFQGNPGTYRVASFWPVVPKGDAQNLESFLNFESIPEAAEFGQDAQGALQARLELATGAMLNGVEGNINLDIERSLPPFLYEVEFYQSREAAHPGLVDCMLGRTNVRYILRPKRADSSATRFVGDVFNGSPAPSALYEDLCFTPRAYVAGNSIFSTDAAKTLDQLASRDFDALNTVILASVPGSSPSVATNEFERTPGGGGSSAGQVEIVQHEPGSVTLQAQLARPAYVVLLDRYDPDWQATVDGRPAPMLRANQVFRAVYAENGTHEICFVYRQRGLCLGVAVSLLTLATLGVLYFKW